ncbi:transglutaminase family protein [Deminuibacter soli]|uniref:Transglutaminase family protein n=1 Tax=Deminuibacter soli TaxID=2291815 RepID=A0A3E1NDA4_9BACT|nr:transglutaminase family protein [Deminuibacter soli]RFM25969.1 transglutaminase family protein [Deminuibacter soli]
MPVFKIHHITRYEYDRPVKESVNDIRIYPYQGPDQEVLLHELNITTHPEIQTHIDYWGNKNGVFNVLQQHTQLIIENRLLIRTVAPAQLRINFHGSFEQLHQECDNQLQLLELAAPDNISRQAGIIAIVQELHKPGKSVAATVEYCSEYIFKHFKYNKGITNVNTTVDEILQHHAGVCQDFAHLMLQILRTLGIPGRYVSGYICPNKNGMRGEGATHAWVEAWLPGYGWAGIDPTNNVWVTNTHVKLAVGRHFNDCSPVKGTFKGPAKQQLSVFVSVSYEDGQVFEEINNVHLNPHAGEQADAPADKTFAQQQ